jgi:hypothetical protein
MVVACLAALAGCDGSAAVIQPINFSHRAHVDGKVDCLQCHEGVLDAEAEPLPSLSVCLACHKDAEADTPAKQELARFAATEEPLVWRPALSVGDTVFFSHPRHVDVAEMKCIDCHADMLERTTPPPKRRTMTMDECIDCHRSAEDRPSALGATFDCARCHR